MPLRRIRPWRSETTPLLTVEETLGALRRAPTVGYRQPGV
jgi:hypothetical protein